jgi:transposase
MATRFNFTQSIEERKMRQFSKEFKKAKVREIEQKKTRIADVCRAYNVSYTAVYYWLKKYGSQNQSNVRTIVESESDTKKLLEMKAKVAELERIIGQKQLQIDFQQKMIELAEEEYGIDIKKKLEKKPSSSSGNTGKTLEGV